MARWRAVACSQAPPDDPSVQVRQELRPGPWAPRLPLGQGVERLQQLGVRVRLALDGSRV